MHYATMFLGSLALLFDAAVALAQDPLPAASTNAQHLAECTADERISNTRAFLIALSIDQGETWTFVDAEGKTSEKIHYILPSYADQPLPPTIWIVSSAARASPNS